MKDRCNDPLFGKFSARVPLRRAPLAHVLGQVRFPKIIKISEENYIGDFQEKIRNKYPHLRRESMQGVEVNLANPDALQHRMVEAVAWRFSDSKKIHSFLLSADNITMETANYVSRDEFLGDFEFILKELAGTIKPSYIQRIGFRYVNRIQGRDNLNILPNLVRPELINVLQPKLLPHIKVSMTEVNAQTKEGNIIVRYGLVPANHSYDISMAPPIQEESWMLDIDSYNVNHVGKKFDAKVLRGELNKVAGRAYAFFRWGVTEQFLDHFGARRERQR